MAKKHTGKVIQMLSPENYIRTKARILPIYECLVNAEWKETGIANIIIARSHVNGNITVCFYLVDIFCLGVKNTHYRFNISKEEYQDMVNQSSDMEPISISYAFMHNIIYAAVEFADEYGFKPHKDFTSITRFMLEEDTDDIELIEIECGKDGKPLYISSEDDSEQKINTILKQLEKTAGIGNFEYSTEDEYDEVYPDEEDEFEDWPFEQKKKAFLDSFNRLDVLEVEEVAQLFKVGESILSDKADLKLYEKYYSEYSEDLNIDILNDKISAEVLGVVPGTIKRSDEVQEIFETIYYELDENFRLVNKLLERFKELTPNIPASYFLELILLSAKKSSKYSKKLNEYAEKFPDYVLIRLLKLTEQVKSAETAKKYLDETYSCFWLFHGRGILHSIEIFHYIRFHLAVLSKFDDLSRISAFNEVCLELDFQGPDLPALMLLLEFIKLQVIHNYLTR